MKIHPALVKAFFVILSFFGFSITYSQCTLDGKQYNVGFSYTDEKGNRIKCQCENSSVQDGQNCLKASWVTIYKNDNVSHTPAVKPVPPSPPPPSVENGKVEYAIVKHFDNNQLTGLDIYPIMVIVNNPSQIKLHVDLRYSQNGKDNWKSVAFWDSYPTNSMRENTSSKNKKFTVLFKDMGIDWQNFQLWIKLQATMYNGTISTMDWLRYNIDLNTLP